MPVTRLFVAGAVLAGVLAWPRSLAADITFNFIYQDTTTGFADPTFGAERQATMSAVGDYLNTVLNANGQVDILVTASEGDGTGFLGSAGSYYFVADGFQNGLAFEHANGLDPSAMVDDAVMTFDFGYAWNSGLDAAMTGEFDLYSVALHEMTHALGFASLMMMDGTSSFLIPYGTDTFTVFDSLLQDGDGNALLDANGNFIGDTGDLVNSNVYFGGANALAANGGNPVPIYSPDPFAEGSSLSHTSIPNTLMYPSIAAGDMRRTLSNVELAMLQDIGWSLNAASVPEPGSLALIALAGVAAGGIRLRRRRSTVLTASTVA